MRRTSAFLGLAYVLLLPAHVVDSQKEKAKMPASVFTVDDPCLGDGSGERVECGTALLQSSMERHRNPEKIASQKVPRQLGTGGNSAAPAKVSAATTKLRAASSQANQFLAEVRQLVAQADSTSFLEVKQLAVEHMASLEADAALRISEAHAEHQRLLNAHADSFAHCDSDLRGRLDLGQELKRLHGDWRSMQGDCQTQEQELSEKLATCKRSLTEKDSGCEEETRLLTAKESECQSLLQTVRTAGCARASQMSGICDMYELCRAGMSLAYGSAKEAANSWKHFRDAELTALATMRCFTANTSSEFQQDRAAVLLKLSDCEARSRTTGDFERFELNFKEPPAAMACSAASPSDSSCAEEISAAKADLEARRGAEAVSGVSLMQEDIERATIVLPKEVRLAFFAPMAAPLSLVVMLLTVLGLMVRCAAYQEEKCEHAAEAAATKAVEAGDGSLLCPELLVPGKSLCTVSMPRLSSDGLPVSALVTDKLGQPLFRANLLKIEKTDSAQTQVLTLMRQDGTVLVTCQLLLPKGKKRGKCNVLDRGGGLFASLDWEDSQVLWSSFFSASRKQEPAGAFVLKGGSAKGWQLRISEAPGGDEEHLYTVLDALRRSVATVRRTSDAQDMLRKDTETGKVYFSSLGQSMFTFFTYGLFTYDLPSVLGLAFSDNIPIGILFCFFILACPMTVMNLLSAFIVEVVRILAVVEQETLSLQYVENLLMTALQDIDSDADRAITQQEFGALLKSQDALEAFMELGIDVLALVENPELVFGVQDKLTYPEFMDEVILLRRDNGATVRDILQLKRQLLEEVTVLLGMIAPPKAAEDLQRAEEKKNNRKKNVLKFLKDTGAADRAAKHRAEIHGFDIPS